MPTTQINTIKDILIIINDLEIPTGVKESIAHKANTDGIARTILQLTLKKYSSELEKDSDTAAYVLATDILREFDQILNPNSVGMPERPKLHYPLYCGAGGTPENYKRLAEGANSCNK